MEEKEEQYAVEENSYAVEVEAEVVEEEVVVEEKKSAPKKSMSRKPRTSLPNPTYVSLKALVYLGVPRNSASVAAVQTRLLELGYNEAGSEQRGWFGPLTGQGLLAFQQDEGIDEEYLAGEQTIAALFEGTHVEVHNL
jgi:peptidoglycan hydrolase-like protein with peptidoglycan-binding domain